MRHIFIAALLILISFDANAQTNRRAIDIKTDKIIINTDSLGMPTSTSAYEVLSILPDLVERTKDFILENYDIQVNGKSVGNARDAVLNQIRISDLKCIEVSENTLSSVSAMGSGGAISLELRSATPGLTGSVNVDVNNEATYAGGIRLDDMNSKLVFHGLVTVENFVPRDFTTSSPTGESTCSTNQDFTELVSGYLEYRPNKADLFKFNVSENYTNSREHDLTTVNNTTSADSRTRTRNTSIFVGSNYEHLFRSLTKLCIEFNYKNIPEFYDGEYFTRNSSYNSYVNNLSGDIKIQQPLIKATSTRSIQLEAGSQCNIIFTNNHSEGMFKNGGDTDTDAGNALSTFDSDEGTYFIRPYAKVESQFNKWQFMATADYQHFIYKSKLGTEDKKSSHVCKDVTGQLVAMYAPNDHNMLRLRYVRSITRPSTYYLFPYPFYDPLTDLYQYGNPDLTPSHQNAVDLDYGLDLSTKEYRLELKASVEYSHTTDIIKIIDKYNIRNYYNQGKSNVLMGDLGLFFQEGHVSTWLSGNVFHKMDDLDNDGNTDHYTYYNLLLRHVIHFGRGWNVAINATFNSAVTTETYKNQGIFYGGLRIAKTWSHLNAFIYGVQNFLGVEKNEVYVNGQTITNDYEYMHSSVGCGVRYNF